MTAIRISTIKQVFWLTTVCSILSLGPNQLLGYATQQRDPITDPFSQTEAKAAPANPRVVQPNQRAVTPRVANAPTTPTPAAQKKSQEAEVPAPENMVLDTSDGVRLMCTYLRPIVSAEASGGKAAAPAIPIILLHDWEGRRGELAQFALFLQSKGYAVILPDLRGHGESTQVTGVDKPIDVAKFRKSEVVSAVKDIERCKKFLVQQHNKGEVNIDMLCVAAVGKSCVLAVAWTLNDWTGFPAFNAQGVKQAQDVKALLLVSPVKKLAGTSLLPSLKQNLFTGRGGPGIPMLVTWGGSDDTAKESEAIYNLLKKSRPDYSKIEDRDERMAKTTLFGVPILKQKYTGQEFISEPKVDKLWPYIADVLFEKKIAANAKSFPWKTRAKKKDDDEDE